MELQPNKNVTGSKSNNFTTSFTNFKQPESNGDTESLYEEITLAPENSLYIEITLDPANLINKTNIEIRDNITTDNLDVNNSNTQAEHPWWKKKKFKCICSGVTVGASVCLIVWISVAISRAGKDAQGKISICLIFLTVYKVNMTYIHTHILLNILFLHQIDA